MISCVPNRRWEITSERIASTARPPAEQEVVAKADAIRHKLDAIRKLLTKSHADLKGLRLDFQRRAKLEQDQSIRLTADLEAVREALGLLEELTREFGGATSCCRRGDEVRLESEFRRSLREKLEAELPQEEIIARAHEIVQL